MTRGTAAQRELDVFALVGRTLAGKYRVDAAVARGARTTVYRAVHAAWHQPVAIRCLRLDDAAEPAEREARVDAFFDEARRMAELSARTAGVAQGRDMGRVRVGGRDVPFIVVEWLDGAPLADVLANERARGLAPRTLEAAIALLDPVAEALALLGEAGRAAEHVSTHSLFVVGDPRGGDCVVKLVDLGGGASQGDASALARVLAEVLGGAWPSQPAASRPAVTAAPRSSPSAV
ncbi:MAG TPA: hypothetical protein VHB21_07035, partial [Minicystis sp.]|nr:hypothetical protein [Minicystis sp.]